MAMVPPGVRSGAWAAGSDAPEKKEVRIGFIPLTDCASVVMAAVNKFDEKYGIKIIPTKEASWASVRDKLVNGELDAAHVLYGLIYGVQLGIGGPKKDMANLMTLNHNGQGITLSNQLKDKGAIDGASLAVDGPLSRDVGAIERGIRALNGSGAEGLAGIARFLLYLFLIHRVGLR